MNKLACFLDVLFQVGMVGMMIKQTNVMEHSMRISQ
jgi:hypothetical protein